MADTASPQIHSLDAAVALEPLTPDAPAGTARRWRGHTSPAYANMVGPYGGITAAQAMQALMLHPDRLGTPVSLTVNYAAALADGAFTVEADPVRTNRSTQHWLLTIRQSDDSGAESVVFTGTALTALRRETWGGDDLPRPEAPAPEAVARLPRQNVLPWINSYDMRWYEGALPMDWDGSESDSSVTALWVRDEPPRPLDFASLTAMSDVFFPRVYLRRATRVPAGTVSMTVYFHADEAMLAAHGDKYLLAQARGQRYFNGYFDQTGALWSEDGQLLVTTHQIVYFKE